MFCYIQVSGSSAGIESHSRSIGIRMTLSRFQSRGSNTVNTMRSSALIKLSAHRSHCPSGIPYRLQCVSMERIHSLTSVYGGRYVWRCQSLRIALIARSGSWYGMLGRKRERAGGTRQTRGSTQESAVPAPFNMSRRAENWKPIMYNQYSGCMGGRYGRCLCYRTGFWLRLSYQRLRQSRHHK